MVEPYNLYVVGNKSYLYNQIKVFGVFPNEKTATQFRSVFYPGSDVFQVGKSQFILGDCGIYVPMNVKKLK